MNSYSLGVIFGAVIIGLICGLVPLIFGLKKGQQTMAIIAMFACVISGAFLGALLAIPVAAVFTIVIWSMAHGTTGISAGFPPVAASSVICPKCSKTIEPGTKFCGNCGQPFA
jgi:hypothetical protein